MYLIEILEEWSIIDRWWTDDPNKTEWVEVNWLGRKLIFRRNKDETIWRIYKNGT